MHAETGKDIYACRAEVLNKLGRQSKEAKQTPAPTGPEPSSSSGHGGNLPSAEAPPPERPNSSGLHDLAGMNEWMMASVPVPLFSPEAEQTVGSQAFPTI